jgi:hypothetical protein
MSIVRPIQIRMNHREKLNIILPHHHSSHQQEVLLSDCSTYTVRSRLPLALTFYRQQLTRAESRHGRHFQAARLYRTRWKARSQDAVHILRCVGPDQGQVIVHCAGCPSSSSRDLFFSALALPSFIGGEIGEPSGPQSRCLLLQRIGRR